MKRGLAVVGGEGRRREAVAAAFGARIVRDGAVDVMPAARKIVALGAQVGDPGGHVFG